MAQLANGSYFAKLADASAEGVATQSNASFLILSASSLSLVAIAHIWDLPRGPNCSGSEWRQRPSTPSAREPSRLGYAGRRGDCGALLPERQGTRTRCVAGALIGVFVVFPTLYEYRSSTTKTDAGVTNVIRTAIDPPSQTGFVKTGIAATAGRFFRQHH